MGQLSAKEVAYWVEQFDRDDLPEFPPPQAAEKTEPPMDVENPFPPGYGDDLLEDDRAEND